MAPEIRRRFHAAAYQGEADSSHHDEDIANAQQWLQANLAENVTISSLAAAVGMHQRTLGRRFKRATGVSPMGYLQNLRMASARSASSVYGRNLKALISSIILWLTTWAPVCGVPGRMMK